MPRQKWTMLLAGVALAVALSALSLSGCSSQAAYPTKAIEVVVTFAAGGGGDVMMRATAKTLSTELKVPINVTNKPGGNQIPGILSVLQAPPDGHTLLYEGSAQSSLQTLVKDLPYKLEDRSWGPLLSEAPYFYGVNAKSPWKTLADLKAAIQKDPANFSYAFLGGAAFTDFTITALWKALGVQAEIAKAKRVPYDGSGPAATALAGGHVQFSGGLLSAAFPLRASGDIRVLAITGDKRVDAMADVPSSKEAGFYVPLTGWNGLSGPKGLPKAVTDRLDQAAQKVTKDPQFIKDMAGLGAIPRYGKPEETWPMIQQEIKLVQEIAGSAATK